MSITRYQRATRLLNYICSYFTIVPAFLLLYALLKRPEFGWTMVFPLAAILISFFLQEYCQNFALFTLGNLVCLLPTFFLHLLLPIPDEFTTQKIEIFLGSPYFLFPTAYFLFGIILIIINFVRKLHTEEQQIRNFPLPYLVVPV